MENVWSVEWGPKEGRVVLHFEFFSAGGGSGFDCVGFLLKDRGRKRVVGWVSIWGEARWVGVWGR